MAFRVMSKGLCSVISCSAIVENCIELNHAKVGFTACVNSKFPGQLTRDVRNELLIVL